MELLIIHSSDVHSTHSSYYNSYLRTNNKSFGGIGKRQTILKQLRTENQNNLLFDCGDYFAGSLFFEEYLGESEIETINYMKYSQIGIGNHDFDKGLDNLKEQIKKLSKNINVLCSNLIENKTGELLFTNSRIITIENNYKIGIFGLLGQHAYNCAQIEFQKEVTLLSPLETFIKIGNELKLQCDLIICLSHCGYDEDLILCQSSVVDILLGGHTHKTYKDKAIIVQNNSNSNNHINNTIEGTIWHQPPSHGTAFGYIKILLQQHDDNTLQRNLQLLDSGLKWADSMIEDDQEILQWFNFNYGDYLYQKIQREIAHCQVETLIRDTEKMTQGNTLLGSFISHFLAESMGTGVGLVNRGGIKSGFVFDERITYGKVVEVLGNNNRLMSVEIKGILLESLLNHVIPTGEFQYYGLEIIKLSESSTNQEQQETKEEVDEEDIDLALESTLHNIKYKINAELLQPDEWYHIALVDYMWQVVLHNKNIYFQNFNESIHGNIHDSYRNIIYSHYWQDRFANYLENLQIISPSTLSHFRMQG